MSDAIHESECTHDFSAEARLDYARAIFTLIEQRPDIAVPLARTGLDFCNLTAAQRAEMRGDVPEQLDTSGGEVERAAQAILADVRGRRLLKWLFAADADTNPSALGYVDGPIDLATQHECVTSWAQIARAALTTVPETGARP